MCKPRVTKKHEITQCLLLKAMRDVQNFTVNRTASKIFAALVTKRCTEAYTAGAADRTSLLAGYYSVRRTNHVGRVKIGH